MEPSAEGLEALIADLERSKHVENNRRVRRRIRAPTPGGVAETAQFLLFGAMEPNDVIRAYAQRPALRLPITDYVIAHSRQHGIPVPPWTYMAIELFRRGSPFWPMYVSQMPLFHQACLFWIRGMDASLAATGANRNEVSLRAHDTVFEDAYVVRVVTEKIRGPTPNVPYVDNFVVYTKDHAPWDALMDVFREARDQVNRQQYGLTEAPLVARAHIASAAIARYDARNAPSPHVTPGVAETVLCNMTVRNFGRVAEVLLEQDAVSHAAALEAFLANK